MIKRQIFDLICAVKKAIWVHSALALVGIIYAANYTIAKEVMPEYLKPFGIILLRVFFGALVFWLVARMDNKESIRNTKDWLRLLACAFFGIATNQLLFFKGLSLTKPINASLIMTTTPILVMVTSHFILHEKLSWKKLLGLGMGLIGAILLLSSSFKPAQLQSNFLGDLMVLGNASSYGIYLVLVKPLMSRYNTITVVKWLFLFGFFMVIPFGYQEVKEVEWQTLPNWVFLALGFIIIGVTIVAYFLNAWALKLVNPSLVGIYIYLQPLLASFIAILAGKDSLSAIKIVSAFLIFSGVYLVSKRT